MTTIDRQQMLDTRHSRYGSIGQDEHESDQRMANGGHPMGEDYRVIRGIFDRLKYAENHGSRYIAFKTDFESVVLKRPDLMVACDTRDMDDYEAHYKVFGDDFFAYPGTHPERYERYLNKCVALRFPKECAPSLEVSLTICTANYRLVADVFTIMRGNLRVEPISNNSRDPLAWRLHIHGYRREPVTAAQVVKIVDAVKRRLGRYMLPERTEIDNAIDSMPVELPQKTFLLSGVDRVTVMDQAVMVPLVPLDDGGRFAQRVATDLVALCRQGYPYPVVRGWLCDGEGKARFVVPSDLRKLDKEFGYRKLKN